MFLQFLPWLRISLAHYLDCLSRQCQWPPLETPDNVNVPRMFLNDNSLSSSEIFTHSFSLFFHYICPFRNIAKMSHLSNLHICQIRGEHFQFCNTCSHLPIHTATEGKLPYFPSLFQPAGNGFNVLKGKSWLFSPKNGPEGEIFISPESPHFPL